MSNHTTTAVLTSVAADVDNSHGVVDAIVADVYNSTFGVQPVAPVAAAGEAVLTDRWANHITIRPVDSTAVELVTFGMPARLVFAVDAAAKILAWHHDCVATERAISSICGIPMR